MNTNEQEYMDYLIHNRAELTKQITKHLDTIILLQKKLDIATKALKKISVSLWDEMECRDCAQKALKEIDEVLKCQ